MKNLTVHRRTGRLLDSLKSTILKNSANSNALYAVNPNNDDFYLLLANKLYKIPSNNEDDITSFDVDANFKFVGLEYCNVSQELYGACESGEIVRLNVDFEFNFEIAMQLNVNLQSMKLSPDHEILTVVTVDGTVITLVSTLQILSEVNLHSSDFGEKQFLTVGWGKKETQFHGSEGKSAAKAKPAEIIQKEEDDGVPRITWREDGSLFAVGFLHNEKRVRMFKVFDREGILQYTSELTNGLEESLAWKPSGSLIATTQNLPHKHVVALFEKNGLKHREFTLPVEPNEITIRDLFWSPDSEILTIWCQSRKEKTSVLQLWCENNYHWYLKQTIKFSIENPLVYATWSTASRSKKLILLTPEELLSCDYNWSIDHSRGKSLKDKAVVGVIDGSKALMTGFRDGIVPPPMSHQSLEVGESINDIVFAPDVENEDSWINSNAFFCISNSGKLLFYKHLPTSPILEYEHIGTYEIEWNIPKIDCMNSLYSLHHFLWLDENTVLCSASATGQSLLCTLILNDINKEKEGHVTIQEADIMEGLIEYIIPSPDPGEAYIVVQNSVFKYTKESGLIPTDVQLQEHCYKVEVVSIGGKHTILSLSHRNNFSIDGKQIANNVISFSVHSEFLLFTTLQHTLICTTLSEAGFDELSKQDLTVKPWENKLNDKSIAFADLNVRRVERGSYLIGAISKDSKAILQMPRGNLECIQPRALSLYIIGYHLNNCDYLSAFDLMRRQRINLNLIYDHDPKKFVENAEKFVQEISKPAWLSLFLWELQNEDITTTTYANYYWKDQVKRPSDVVNKVEYVCELLRNIMENKCSKNSLLQPILISLVKSQKKGGLEAALAHINRLRIQEKTMEDAPSITSEDALLYLWFIVDKNILFDTALGMYDFDLTMLIASKSQKDPKEYIPFLNDLKKLDTNYMKYSIDVYLKRYESALTHIAKEKKRFNECINLITNHELYTKALRLFDKDSMEYKEVARVYAEYLMEKKKYQEAAIMFHKSGDLEEALNAYKIAGSWQEAIILSAQMNLSNLEKQTLYRDLVDKLRIDRKYQDAATVLANYLRESEEAVSCLCDGKHWREAMRIAYDTQRSYLIELRLKPAVYEYANHVTTQLEKAREDFERHKSRLATVRAAMVEKNRQMQEGESDNELSCNQGISDILSDTTSVSGSTLSQRSKSSTSSGRSYRSSKNRRKQERKMLSMKEGSTFEDLGLIQALHQIITRTYKERDDVNGLVQMLVHFDDEKFAEKLQILMEDFLRQIELSKSKIWDKSAPLSLAEMESPEFAMSTQFQELSAFRKLVEPYVRYPPEASSTPWKLDLF